MDAKRRKRYTLAVYLIIALVAVIFYLLGRYYFTGGTVHELVISLASELTGVVLLFFVVNQFFLLDQEQDVFNRLEELIPLFESRFAILGLEEQLQDRLGFPKRLINAQRFDFLALDASRVLKDCQDDIVKGIVNGLHFRMILVDWQSQAASLIQDRMREEKESMTDYYPKLKDIEDSLVNFGRVAGKFQVRVINWVPSCRIMIFDAGTDTEAMVVNIYPTAFKGAQYTKRKSLFLTSQSNLEWYQYFKEEFEKLWVDGTDWKQATRFQPEKDL